MTAERKEKFANEILRYLVKNGLFNATLIYFNGKCFQDGDIGSENHEIISKTVMFSDDYNDSELEERYDVYLLGDIYPEDYFYCKNGIISISTEGDLYDYLNYYDESAIVNGFNKIFKKYGTYYEFGDTWNITAYPL